MDQKHAKVERRRKQFDGKDRYGRVGASRKQAMPRAWRGLQRDLELTVSRPRNEDFLEMVTHVDAEWELEAGNPYGVTGMQILEFERALAEQ